MKDSISITIPMEYHALTRASDFLHGLAKDAQVAGMRADGPSYPDGPEFEGYENRADEKTARHIGAASMGETSPARESGPDPVAPAAEPEYIQPEYVQTQPERDAATAFMDGVAPDTAPTASEQGTAQPAETTADAAHIADTSGVAQSATEAAGTNLDLDADGLPWDGRIHSSSKKKLQKTEQWKKRRKPPEQEESQWQAYVDSVESELRRVMQAGPHAPVSTPAPTPEAPSAPEPAPAPAPSEPTPHSAATEQAQITTLPELFRYITDNNVSDERALAAVRAQGIESFALLGARPDLVPAVAKALQEG